MADSFTRVSFLSPVGMSSSSEQALRISVLSTMLGILAHNLLSSVNLSQYGPLVLGQSHFVAIIFVGLWVTEE